MNAMAMAVETEAQKAVFLLTMFAVLGACVAFWSFLGRWAYRDARTRGRDGTLVAVLVIFFFPLGLLLWLILRPPVVPITPVKLRFYE